MEKYDLIVAGGGPSGVAAAVSAARNGIKVLLIEQSGFLGGMATNASVPAFCPYSDGNKRIIGGIGYEVLEEMKKNMFVSPFYDYKPDRIEGLDWVPIDSEALKQVLDRLVIESGCKVLFHTSVIKVYCENDKIISVDIFNKGGIENIQADFYADCTGDADLLAMAGGAYEYGDEKGLVQAATLCFRLANFNIEEFMAYASESGEDGNLSKASAKAIAAGEFLEGEKHVCGISFQAEGMAGVNFGHVYNFNPLNGEALSEAEFRARTILPKIMEFFHKYVPGAQHTVLASSGPHIGVRESRRIVGEYQLTKVDYYQRADFCDAIAYYAYPIDMHAAQLKKNQENTEASTYMSSKYNNGESYGIPYRCLLPKSINNMIVAGRTISADRAMLASVRVMPACFATGQAAGTAVALCVKQQQCLRNVDICKLQQTLKEQGAYLRD